ncbi:MAG: alpha/beta fold hydrolase [Terracidiphilus sp.]
MNAQVQSQFRRLALDGKQIEVALHTAEDARGTILLLHEALGSVAYWRDFPEKLAAAAGANVLHYSRPGHGNSDGPLEERNPDYYLRQTGIVIPELLDRFGLDAAIVYGHSEGAGIAMLFAAQSRRAQSLILESPFVVAEASSAEHIARMAAAYRGSKLQERLALYHRDADEVFYAWADWATGLTPEMPLPHALLKQINCPVLVLQGENDVFGSTVHREALRAALRAVEFELFANTGHLPHREQTEPVLNRIARFLAAPGPLAYPGQPPNPPSFIEEQL